MTLMKSNEQVAEADIKFPLIMKTLRGSKGVGVLFIDSEKGLDSIVQLIHKQDEDADLLIQEYIKTDYDVRVHVLGGKSIGRPWQDQLLKEILGQMYRKVLNLKILN